MENQNLERVHNLMNSAVLPEATKSSLQAALRDAALRGFHIDFEQLQTNLSLIDPESWALH